MGYVTALRCRECGKEYEKKAIHVCEFCFGPLEVAYDYDAIAKVLTKKVIESRGKNMWRYKELLPLDEEPTSGPNVGFTPLHHAKNLGEEWGMKHLYVKNDSVNHPTFSFKDRVVACAVSKAAELGFRTVGCASTGNLANSVAALAAQSKMEAHIFIPADLEAGKVVATQIFNPKLIKIKGSYDDVNRLCSEIGDKYPIAFVNINIRAYYGEGSKTYGYEIAEQLGWKAPDQVVVPIAGSSLITKIDKALKEFERLGFIDSAKTKIFGAQATGCSPVTTAVKEGWTNFKPQKPNTIARSIAIGNPADGFYGIKVIKESGGWGEDVSDQELVEGMKLLANHEGIFTETAGGVVVATAKKLLDQGRLDPEKVTVLCVTGNGLKTLEALDNQFQAVPEIHPRLDEYEKVRT
ncbi:MAG: threonine synthase [Nitrospinota bacterium]|nr:threonine synthase [Nitrospinota bacterium]